MYTSVASLAKIEFRKRICSRGSTQRAIPKIEEESFAVFSRSGGHYLPHPTTTDAKCACLLPPSCHEETTDDLRAAPF